MSLEKLEARDAAAARAERATRARDLATFFRDRAEKLAGRQGDGVTLRDTGADNLANFAELVAELAEAAERAPHHG